ncbi:hypothetical protein [Wolbachia endosymbiont (group E) of Neria commutata]|uniref:hypothetical protein n=1 Tax=Wolbachia endosymbiont (group E) of Neria commutata TaxID=3066149 RepID=UPI0031332436
MAMVDMLLLAGNHPNNIVLDTNSMGGGIATEVLKRFEEQGIYLTLIHSNSYSSLKDVSSTFKGRLAAQCLNILHKFFGLEFNSKADIEKMKSPVLIAGRKDDPIITEDAQLVGKLPDLDGKNGNRLRQNVILEHDPEKKDCEITNIHTDDEKHLVGQWKNSDTYTLFPEIKSKFISEAHDNLMNSGLNKKFDSEEYRGSKFSRDLTPKITLVRVNKAGNLLRESRTAG